MSSSLLSEETTLSLSIDPGFGVDLEKQELTNLAIMTGGRVALGHGIYLDQKTIETGANVVKNSGGQLRGAIKHPSLLDRLTGNHDRVLSMPGYFSGVKVDGNKIVAEKFQFFETFKTDNPKAVARILEMAQKTPRLFGLSAEPAGKLVYVGLDGTEYPFKRDPDTGASLPPKDVPLANEGLPTLRITHLAVAAFVDQPAANDSLFTRLSSLFGAEQKELRALVKEFASAFKNELTAPATLPVSSHNEDPGATANSPQSNQIKETAMPLSITEITAKFGADEARLTQALKLASQNPAFDLASIEAALVKVELAAKDKTIADLTAQLATANKSAADLKASTDKTIADLTKERDEYKGQFEAIKNSGGILPLNLNGQDGQQKTSGELKGHDRVAAAFTAQIAALTSAKN